MAARAVGLWVRLPAAAQTATRSLVVSTDLGADDLLAIAWLVNDPALDVPAILVTGTGLADCTTGVDDLRALLAALDAEGPEVGCGATVPLGGGTPFPADQRAAAAGLYGLALPPAVGCRQPHRDPPRRSWARCWTMRTTRSRSSRWGP